MIKKWFEIPIRGIILYLSKLNPKTNFGKLKMASSVFNLFPEGPKLEKIM